MIFILTQILGSGRLEFFQFGGHPISYQLTQIHTGKTMVLPVLPTSGRRVGYKHLQWLKRETFHYFFPPLSTLIQILMMGSKPL